MGKNASLPQAILHLADSIIPRSRLTCSHSRLDQIRIIFCQSQAAFADEIINIIRDIYDISIISDLQRLCCANDRLSCCQIFIKFERADILGKAPWSKKIKSYIELPDFLGQLILRQKSQ